MGIRSSQFTRTTLFPRFFEGCVASIFRHVGNTVPYDIRVARE